VRNRLVNAAIENARTIQALRVSGGLVGWWAQHFAPEWVKLFRRTFRFTGGEIGEFLMPIVTCPRRTARTARFAVIARLQPPWDAPILALSGLAYGSRERLTCSSASMASASGCRRAFFEMRARLEQACALFGYS
jgi:hypothetical protein